MSTETPTEPNVEEPTPSHYRFMFQGSKIDPYRIFTIYGITHPAQQHAIKKLLRAGQSHKGLAQDIGEVIQALNRWLEMISESEPKLITELEQQRDRLLHTVNNYVTLTAEHVARISDLERENTFLKGLIDTSNKTTAGNLARIAELEQQVSGKTEERTPDPGNGFRLLRKGDIVPKGADHWRDGGWIKSRSEGDPDAIVGQPGYQGFYRVPYTPPFPGHPSPPFQEHESHVKAPDPGEGFRLLAKGELITTDAEFFGDEGWERTAIGNKDRITIGEDGKSAGWFYRVPIEKPKEPVKAPDELREFVSSGAWTEDTLKMVEIIASRFESIEAQLQQNKQ